MSYHSDPNWRTRPAPVVDKTSCNVYAGARVRMQ
jgi:hypothetical protein